MADVSRGSDAISQGGVVPAPDPLMA